MDDLGPMCDHFDFQSKEEVGDGSVRPVHCSEVESNDPHPQFTLFVFSDSQTRAQWLEKPLEGTGSVSDDDWVAISDLPLLDEVEERLNSE